MDTKPISQMTDRELLCDIYVMLLQQGQQLHHLTKGVHTIKDQDAKLIAIDQELIKDFGDIKSTVTSVKTTLEASAAADDPAVTQALADLGALATDMESFHSSLTAAPATPAPDPDAAQGATTEPSATT